MRSIAKRRRTDFRKVFYFERTEMKKVIIKDGLLIRVQKVLMRVRMDTKRGSIEFEVVDNPDFVEIGHEKEVAVSGKRL